MARGKISVHAAFTIFPNFFLLLVLDQRPRVVKNGSFILHISNCVDTVYELPFLPNKAAMKHFYTNRKRCVVLTAYSSLRCRPGGEWADA